MIQNIIDFLYIKKYKGFKDFKISFNEKITVLVGENGTGKTTILEIIFNVLSGNTNYFLDDSNFEYVELSMKNEEKIKVSNESGVIRLLLNNVEVDANHEFFIRQKALYFPAEVTFSNYEVNGPRRLDLTETDVYFSSEKMSRELKQFLINQKYKDLNDIAKGNVETANRIEQFKKIYNGFLQDKKFVDIDDETFEPLFELNETKEQITVNKLSSGEKQIFYKGGSLLQYGADKKLIVLIDEPEISMHPEWQQRILKFYKQINESCQFIFSTHSPHIVSCCKKEEIKVIEKKDNSLVLDDSIVNTYGVTNEEILFKVFGLSTVRNIEVQKDLDEYKQLYYRKNLLNDDEKKKFEELREKLIKFDGLSDYDISMLEYKSNTDRFEEILKKLGD